MASEALSGRFEALAGLFERALCALATGAAGADVPNLNDALAYALGTDIEDPALRGKRIRPVLCLLTAETLGASLEAAMPFALAIELMHNFCLVHDDIEDGDIMRRGRDSVWIRYGLAHGVNIGDYLLVQSGRVLAESGGDRLDADTRLRLLRLLGRTLDHTHIGQALDINARADRSLGVEDYMRLVREKTGFYLAAPIQGGAIAAGADGDVISTIGAMAQFLGPMFQIMDDIIDLTAGKGREARGSDIREGKRSFMVAWTAARSPEPERERLFAILDKKRGATTAADVDWVAELFERCGAIEAGRAHCRKLHEESQAHLTRLPPALAEALGPVFESLASRTR